jgi:antibiotic biosynthesis monooxygenase (ABM) superfamily enzyme
MDKLKKDSKTEYELKIQKKKEERTIITVILSSIGGIIVMILALNKTLRDKVKVWGYDKWVLLSSFVSNWWGWVTGNINEKNDVNDVIKKSKILTFLNQYLHFRDSINKRHLLSSIMFTLGSGIAIGLTIVFLTAINLPYTKGNAIWGIVLSILATIVAGFFYIRVKNKEGFFKNDAFGLWSQLVNVKNILYDNRLKIASIIMVILGLTIAAGVTLQSEKSAIMGMSTLGVIAGIIGMFVVYTLIINSSFFEKIKQFKPFLLLFNLIFIIPCLISIALSWVTDQVRNTPSFVYTVLLIELVIILLYFVIPSVDRRFYFSLTNKKSNLDELNEIIKMNKQTKDNLHKQIFKIKKKFFIKSNNKNVINMNKKGVEDTWIDLISLFNNKELLKNRLIELGFCYKGQDTDSCDEILKERIYYLEDYKEKIVKMEQQIAGLKTEISPNEQLVETDEDDPDKSVMKSVKDAIVLQMKPVSLKNITTPTSIDKINIFTNVANQTNYSYGLSFWVFIHPQSGNIKQCNNIIDFDGRPKVMYCPTYNKIPNGDIVKYVKDGNIIRSKVVKSKLVSNEYVVYTLKNTITGKIYKNVHHSQIKYNYPYSVLKFVLGSSEETQQEYALPNLKMQKWNNIVINYIDGIYDLFVNGEMVNSFQGGMEEFKYNNITIGEDNGVSGGIANIVYYKNYLTKNKIIANYNSLKHKSPPIISNLLKV